MSVLSVILCGYNFLFSLLTGLFFLEIIAARGGLRGRTAGPAAPKRHSVAVLIPAHNESAGLKRTIEDVKVQLRPGDRLVIVADNCTDSTAAVAISEGVEVSERNDVTRIGKGFALEWGVKYLSSDPPSIVIIVDADCWLSDHTIEELTRVCTTLKRPAQALNLMVAGNDPTVGKKVAEFAWRVKNGLRPLGLRALNLPCQLMGTGMAFPWDIIQSVDLATDDIVEDLKLGLDLAHAGHAAMFCPTACVTSVFPSTMQGEQVQRRRWEQGHIAAITKLAPKLLARSIADFNLRLMILVMDMAVPPLTLLGLLLVGNLLVAIFGVLMGLSSVGLFASMTNFFVFVLGIFLCWLKVGRDLLSMNALPGIIRYGLAKLPLYSRFLSRKPRENWTRTDRSNTKPPGS